MENSNFYFQDSVCKQVANRDKTIKNFCKNKDLIIFMSGKKSSNGRMLYQVCNSVNNNTKFVSQLSEIKKAWFKDVKNVGISGATSTPYWLLQRGKKNILKFFGLLIGVLLKRLKVQRVLKIKKAGGLLFLVMEVFGDFQRLPQKLGVKGVPIGLKPIGL